MSLTTSGLGPYFSAMKKFALPFPPAGLVLLALIASLPPRDVRGDTRLTILVTNIPSGWGTANGDAVAVIGTLNGWSPSGAAVIQGHSLRYDFASVPTPALGSEWIDKPAGANLGFRFVDPGNTVGTLIKTDFRANDGNFRLAIAVGSANTVEIDAAPTRLLIDQASAVRVNGVREREVVRIDRSRFAFPGGLWKALIMSYDDGHDQDRGLIPIFNQYGIKGTFHLNSGWLDTATFVSSDDVRTLYAPHEVSVHTVDHPDLTGVSDETIRWEVGHCRWALAQLTGYEPASMSYPMGGYDTRVIGQLPGQGIKSSRTVEATFSLDFLPADPLKWHPTCHHANASGLADEFIARTQEQMALLFIWGHSYELDNGYADNSWASMSALCAKLGHRGDTWYAGMEEVRAYLAAIRELTYPASHVIRNPSSSITVWAKPAGTLIKIAPGKTITYPAGQVVSTPALPYEDAAITITYTPGSNALAAAAGRYIHLGRDGWQGAQDLPLAQQSPGVYACTVTIPAGTKTLEWAFFNGADLWDDNGGADWSIAVRGHAPGTPAALDLVPGSPAIAASHAGQNATGETVDFNTAGRSANAISQGGFGQFGDLHVNYDDHYFYIGGTGMNPGGTNNAVILFLQFDTLKNAADNLWDFAGTPYGLDQLHNVGFSPAVNVALLLGDEYGDGQFLHFNLENGYDFGQGLYYLDTSARRFLPIPGAVVSQFDGVTNRPTQSADDDGNRQTDRWEAAIPWSSLNAPMGVRSIGSCYLSGLIASDGVSGNDRYISANALGASVGGTLDQYGNYGFNFVTLAGQRVGLAEADSDGDGMPDVWENKHQLDPTKAADAGDDGDRDGRNNGEEYIAGTDPTNRASVFQCLEISPANFPTPGRMLRWTGVTGRVYSVEGRTNLLVNWTKLAADLPPAGAWTDTVHALDQQMYYRLGVRLP